MIIITIITLILLSIALPLCRPVAFWSLICVVIVVLMVLAIHIAFTIAASSTPLCSPVVCCRKPFNDSRGPLHCSSRSSRCTLLVVNQDEGHLDLLPIDLPSIQVEFGLFGILVVGEDDMRSAGFAKSAALLLVSLHLHRLHCAVVAEDLLQVLCSHHSATCRGWLVDVVVVAGDLQYLPGQIAHKQRAVSSSTPSSS